MMDEKQKIDRQAFLESEGRKMRETIDILERNFRKALFTEPTCFRGLECKHIKKEE